MDVPGQRDEVAEGCGGEAVAVDRRAGYALAFANALGSRWFEGGDFETRRLGKSGSCSKKDGGKAHTYLTAERGISWGGAVRREILLIGGRRAVNALDDHDVEGKLFGDEPESQCPTPHLYRRLHINAQHPDARR